jgi:hypothetical protein
MNHSLPKMIEKGVRDLLFKAAKSLADTAIDRLSQPALGCRQVNWRLAR